MRTPQNSPSAPLAVPTASNARPELLPIPAWPHPWPSQAAWRHYLFDAHVNGLLATGAVVRTPGKRGRWLINTGKFWAWCETQGEGNPNAPG